MVGRKDRYAIYAVHVQSVYYTKVPGQGAGSRVEAETQPSGRVLSTQFVFAYPVLWASIPWTASIQREQLLIGPRALKNLSGGHERRGAE